MKQLLAFLVVLSVVFLLPTAARANEKKEGDDPVPYRLTDEELDEKLGVDEDAEAPEIFVWVVYFHRVPGCDTCKKMAKYVFETVDTRFKDDTRIKKVVLRYRDIEEKKNADLVKKLKIRSPALALMIVDDGKLTKAKIAGKIWSHVGDKDKFMDYVEEEIAAYKKSAGEAKQ